MQSEKQEENSTASSNGINEEPTKFSNSQKMFDKIKLPGLDFFNTHLDRITKLKEFTEYALNMNFDNIDNESFLSMSKYFEALSTTMISFDRMLAQMDMQHAEIKKIREGIERLEESMKLVNDLIASNKIYDAIEICTEALDTKLCNNLTTLELLYKRAFANSKIGNFRQAIDDCRKALEINPMHVNALLLRAQFYEYLEEFEVCIQDYKTALCTPEIEESSEKVEEIRSKLEKITIVMQHRRAEEKNSLANNHYHNGNYGLAKTLFTEAINLWPNNSTFYVSRCKTLISLKDFKTALEDSKRATAIDKSSVVGYEYMAKCCLIIGDYDNAEQAIKELLLNSHVTQTFIELKDKCMKLRECEKLIAECYNEGRLQRAISHTKWGMKILPKSIRLKLLISEFYMLSGEVEEIIKFEDVKAFSLTDRCYVRSLISFVKGNIGEALMHLIDGLKMDEEHEHSNRMQATFLHINSNILKGDQLFAEQKFHQAVDIYTELLEYIYRIFAYCIVPSHNVIRDLYYSRALAHFKAGNFQFAIDDCITLDNKKDVKVLLLLAKSYEFIGNFEKSIKFYESALKFKELKTSAKQFANITSKIESLKMRLRRENARKMKINGDKFYKERNYRYALDSYAKAISLWPVNISFYLARIECLMKIKEHKAAIVDCRTALTLNSTVFYAYEFMIKCYLAIGEASCADREIRKYAESVTKSGVFDECREMCRNLKRFKEMAIECLENGRFLLALEHVNDALEIAYDSVELKIMKGDILISLKRFEDADEIATSCIKLNPLNADALYVHAMCIYDKNWEHGLKSFQQVIALDPDHKKAKTMISKIKQFQEQEKIANKLLEEQKYREAREKFTEVLEISPVNSTVVPKLLHDRAIANSKTGFFHDAIKDCTNAMKNSWIRSKCLQIRANCFMAMRKFKFAVADFEELFKIDKSKKAENQLKEAKCALERFQSDNFYDILDVEKTASTEEIKKSYKRLALIHHPDKNPSDEKLEQQELFKKISVAHEVLSDPKKRDEYDRKCERKNKNT